MKEVEENINEIIKNETTNKINEMIGAGKYADFVKGIIGASTKVRTENTEEAEAEEAAYMDYIFRSALLQQHIRGGFPRRNALDKRVQARGQRAGILAAAECQLPAEERR